MEKEQQGLEEGLKAKIHLDLLRATFKKVPNWKTLGHDGIHGYGKNILGERIYMNVSDTKAKFSI